MPNLTRRITLTKHYAFPTLALSLIVALLAMPLQHMHSSAQKNDSAASEGEKRLLSEKITTEAGVETNNPDIVPFLDFGKSRALDQVASPEAIGTDQGSETEPNDTFATADVLTGTDGKIKGSLFGPTPLDSDADTDWYQFTTTVPNSKIYAATINHPSPNTDTLLAVFAGDGTTQLEIDDDDGTFGTTSSTISGTTLATTGTYYLRVTNFSTTQPIPLYDLYFAVRDGATTPETEPNNNGTPQALPVSQYVNGVIDPVGDTDTFSFTANAGDTVFLSQDLDPERDVTTFNGRIGIGLFGTPTTFLVTSDGGTDDTIDSEALVMTVKTTGTYQVYVDSQVAGGGGPTATYAFNVTVIPAAPSGTCTTYTNSTSTPIPDLALTSSTITIPDSRIIRSLRVITDITHPNYPDLDVHLRSPANNDNGLFTDVGASTQTGAQNTRLEDEAALPLIFTVINGANWRPEPAYRLNWFKGENSLGTWTLDIRDDSSTVATPGTLNSWSLEVCEEAAPVGNLIYDENFEAGNGGYTLGPSNVANEWEYGTPATAQQTAVSPFIAAFNTCSSGVNCWKTDLDNTYNVSSSQDLTSPVLTLNQFLGSIRLYWQQRYQMESTNFDRIWVRVTNVNNPTETRVVWHSDNQSMGEANGSGASLANLPESAGWGRYSADISDFAGDAIQITFHLESDSTVNYGGWAIDDVQLRHLGPTAAHASISGRVMAADGRGLSNARVTFTDQSGDVRTVVSNAFGYYTIEDLEIGRTYNVSVSRKGYSFEPAVITPQDNVNDLNFVGEQQE